MKKTELPKIGKVSQEVFEEVILPQLGRKRKEVIFGPRHGVDVGIVDLGNHQVMVTTTDPIFVVPPYGWERSAWFAVHILASDAVTSGLAPNYITLDLNLPMRITRDELEALWSMMHRECEKIGMSVISGHTGRYEGCEYPMIGGATVICVGPKDSYVTPTMAGVGDTIIITKGAAIEAAGLFAVTFPQKIAGKYGEKTAKEAEEIFWQMSVVDDALTAAQVGVRDQGVTAMHDATECGVWGGLVEIAQASNVGMTIDKEKIILQENIKKICDMFEIDPYSSISEGTLIITAKSNKAGTIVQRLEDKGIPVSIVGEIVEREKGRHYFENGKEYELVHPEVDPFWGAFGKAASEAN
ncbi:AIR synthase [candidate division KSB1 bacterium]|nr:AIR synthase [candidate division KSB1 bacterium]NIR68516.1 AIR synthase [candidate division KSB1 bacterium]NIS22530.1 AIR synthase [candidate division KSB1 bacterium]NIT69374.1 AIR synthase [candidate division KSB1 bacterium]NIU23035.1 AIR synthase [candidate division KSB1 bacterium]